MAQLLPPVLARAVRALAEGALPAVTVLLEVHARRARPVADDALVDDLARADDGLGLGAGVLGVLLAGLDGFHAGVEDVLHWLHCEWSFDWEVSLIWYGVRMVSV